MSFYSSIAENYAAIFPFNPVQFTFITQNVKKSELKQMLEIGSATGILTAACNAEAYPIQGLELDPEMVKIAQNQHPAVVFRQGNMLDLDRIYGQLTFDAMVCFGNTIVHLKDLAEIELFLAKAYKQLAAGGKLLIQFINYDRIIDHAIRALPSIENAHITFERRYDLIDHKALDFKATLTIHSTQEVISNTQRLLPLRRADFESIAWRQGFKTSVYGSFAMEPWSQDTMQSIFVCKK